ncbi:MAG: aminodeoxychorismate synthase component I, partial [Gammaproteobacteria bacterium]|nr:aminodeoxychorismate synthase component I [Gammaproteobacteria bacterium]
LNLPYHSDSALLFENIHLLPGAVFLDSCAQHSKQGRYDILAALPYLQLDSFLQYSVITSLSEVTCSRQAPFDILKSLLIKESIKNQCQELADLPFSGGAIAAINYELTHSCLSEDMQGSDSALMNAGFYDVFIIVDHRNKSCTAYSLGEHTTERFQRLIKAARQVRAPDSFKLNHTFKRHLTPESYRKNFSSIQEFILSGDCYQINYTQRFDARYAGDPWFAYKKLRQISPAPFSAYVNRPQSVVLSHSPEQFIQHNNGNITSKPIKGTRARKPNPQEDALQQSELIQSKKDRAENTMIVDLLRNDIGRNAMIGSVNVPLLCQLESYANVHHLVSTITATLAEKSHPVDLFRDSFPGGSITGAPKKRAMEIIDELEDCKRNIYCGSIAYFSFNGKLDSNITIRTLLCEKPENEEEESNIYCWGGGGIIADSTLKEEYQESIDKVSNLLKTLEQTFRCR